MAKVKYGFGISSIAGKIGETVFATWKSGRSYIRTVSQNISNAHSPAQFSARNEVALQSKIWNDTLTDNDRTGWNTWALSKPRNFPNTGGVNELIKGNNGIMSGLNALILANGLLKSCGLVAVQAAPLAEIAPSSPTAVVVSAVGGTVTVDWTDPVQCDAGAYMRIFIRLEAPGMHPYLKAAVPVATLSNPFTVIKGAKGQNLLLSQFVGKRIHVQMDCVNPGGTSSNPSNVASCLVA